MTDTTSKNERALAVMGRRFTPEQEGAVIPFDCPCELGYWCPTCRIEWDESLAWSEYASFLWCPRCNFDWPSALCIRIDATRDPERDWKNAGREDAVRIFLDSVADAIRRAATPAADRALDAEALLEEAERVVARLIAECGSGTAKGRALDLIPKYAWDETTSLLQRLRARKQADSAHTTPQVSP